VLRDHGDAEEVMQQAYVNAYTHLHQFEERAQFSTWLTRIALNEALGERRRLGRRDHVPIDSQQEGAEQLWRRSRHEAPIPSGRRTRTSSARCSRTRSTAFRPLPRRLHAARRRGDEHEGDGDGLQLGEEAVKTRLHRARALLRRRITERVGAAAAESFQFHASRCDRVVAGVMARIHARSLGHQRETDRQYMP
jgi:RNA polymerase sigma-70 factor (ECF subfamily)